LALPSGRYCDTLEKTEGDAMKIFYAIIGTFFLVVPCIAEEPATFSDRDLEKYKAAPMFEEDRSFKEKQEILGRENEKIISDIDEREAKRKAEKKAQQDLEERENAKKTEEDKDNVNQDRVLQDGGGYIVPIIPRPRPQPQPRPRLY
jgi:hypothetical protein